jgi:hypothetical protein
MADETESIRRRMVAEINADPGPRADLERQYGRVWDTSQLTEDFEVLGFAAPLVVVRRRLDRVRGSLMFQHNPRFYFGFQPEEDKSEEGWSGIPRLVTRMSPIHQTHKPAPYQP